MVATVVVMVAMPRRRGRWTMVTAVMNGGGTVGNAGTAMRCREAGSRQGKSGHEGHEEFLVVRVITILFLPLWALQVERETHDNNLTGQTKKFSTGREWAPGPTRRRDHNAQAGLIARTPTGLSTSSRR